MTTHSDDDVLPTVFASGPRPAGEWTPERRATARSTVVRILVMFALLLVGIPATLIGLAIGIEELERIQRERAQVELLYALADAQTRIRDGALIDTDGDGIGEYAMGLELSGRSSLIGAPDDLLPSEFGGYTVRTGSLVASGYQWKVYLPGAGGVGVEDPPVGHGPDVRADVDAQAAETRWCAYGWPAGGGSEGDRAYFINAAGEACVTELEEGAYGPFWPGVPRPGAALTSGGLHSIVGEPADGEFGQDGLYWTRLD